MYRFVLLATLLLSCRVYAISKQDNQEFYEQMGKHSLCAAIATYTNNNELHDQITNYMYDKLDTYVDSEYLSNTKRGFMVGYSIGMSQAVFGQLYTQQGKPQGVDIKSFAKIANARMCQNLKLN
ncbi:hypothetical protein MD588_18780 [Photobacterium sp. SDRW27]|uniref:hypothetical protein n=1 Tax=Photobacterium obscurum TaxID=2829490 RepID=UPI002243DEAE|nr:hypothetical protein [Photobacterium obscurum]MCW8330841.1 hypothetical protein [Photobacterium obscurum]